MSYSRFILTTPRVNKVEFKRTDELAVEVGVLNESDAAGEETVFLFARDVVASVARPVLELKGVCKIALAPGEAGTGCFRLGAEALAFPGSDFCFRRESGAYGPANDTARASNYYATPNPGISPPV